MVTDNASVCQKAGELVTAKYKHIVWTGCAAHGISLLYGDICKESWAAEVIEECKGLASFIRNHHMTLALFRQKCKKELLRPNDTRFMTNHILCARVLEVEEGIREMFGSSEWAKWIEGQRGEVKATGEKYEMMTHRVSDFWTRLREFVSIGQPIWEVLKIVDSSMPTSGKVYNLMFELGQKLQQLEVDEDKASAIKAIWTARWNFLHSILHSVCYQFDPEFQGCTPREGEEVTVEYLEYLEVIYPDVEKQIQAEKELKRYREGDGIFGRGLVKASANKMPSAAYWARYGTGCPVLQPLAVKALSQVSCASSCERNWSLYDFIHSKRRNRLSSELAEKLVYVHSNLRLLNKVQAVDYEETFIPWSEFGFEEDHDA